MPPVLASIDVGSNTLRLLIAEIKDGRVIDIFSDRKITRLGQRVDETGFLQEENMALSLAALQEFSLVISKYCVRHVKAVATSALRESSNSDIFVRKVFDESGILINVISGDQEAGLTLRGILLSFPDASFTFEKPAFIVDIGGGSSEWILYRGKDHIDMGSIPVGVIKLSRKFLRADPISDDDMNELNRELRPFVEDMGSKIGHLPGRSTRFIGTAGTFTTIASIDLALENYSREKIHLHTLTLTRLQEMREDLAALSLKEREKIIGLEPERADLIIPGIQFTINIMNFFHFDKLLISDYGLLEGVLFALKESIEKGISASGES